MNFEKLEQGLYMYHFNLGVLSFMGCTGMGVYGVWLYGWSSNYALLGSIRSVAQTISYEVSMILILVCVFILIIVLNFFNFIKCQEYICLFLFLDSLRVLLNLIVLLLILLKVNQSLFLDLMLSMEGVVALPFIFSSEYINIMFVSAYINLVVFFSLQFISFIFFLMS